MTELTKNRPQYWAWISGSVIADNFVIAVTVFRSVAWRWTSPEDCQPRHSWFYSVLLGNAWTVRQRSQWPFPHTCVLMRNNSLSFSHSTISNYMEHGPSCKPTNRSVSEEILCLLKDAKFHCRVCKRQLNSVQTSHPIPKPLFYKRLNIGIVTISLL
jgi:hypothetical protein